MVCEKVKQLVCQYPTLLNVCPTLFHPKHLKKLLMGGGDNFYQGANIAQWYIGGQSQNIFVTVTILNDMLQHTVMSFGMSFS